MVNQTRAKPASQGPQVTTQYHLSDYTVLASFPTLAEARLAIEALGRAGIEGKRITIGGEAGDRAAMLTETSAADSRVMSRWFGYVAQWAVLGVILGVVAGIPVGAAVIELAGGGITLGAVVASAFLGALFAGMIAGLVAAFYAVQAGDSWELTFQETYGDTAIVGVHSDAPDEIEKARSILKRRNPLNVRVTGKRMSPQDAMNAMSRAAR
jgi:hypothetical protein